MIVILVGAGLLAFLNITLAFGVERVVKNRHGKAYGWLQGLGMALKLLLVFGLAHYFWLKYGRADWVALFIIVVSVFQLVGQISILNRPHSSKC